MLGLDGQIGEADAAEVARIDAVDHAHWGDAFVSMWGGVRKRNGRMDAFRSWRNGEFGGQLSAAGVPGEMPNTRVISRVFVRPVLS